jgi:hypothetical protein
MPDSPKLVITGPETGLPSVEDLVALYTKLTGKTPTPEEIQALRAKRQER